MDLNALILHALNEGCVYSALVPWILDCTHQVWACTAGLLAAKAAFHNPPRCWLYVM